ncbi:MAG: ribbon-helix-helix protein, CopG family [Alphaproteobacteria bacterium]|nr:ribbon-helix-helix protein, CopG family [Alphaproteobacteria bacterium]
MNDSTVLSVRIDKSVKDRLAKLAANMKRSQSFLAAEAIEEFVDVQEWQVAGINEALETLDRGESIPHDDVKAWAVSLGSDNERPVPKSK